MIKCDLNTHFLSLALFVYAVKMSAVLDFGVFGSDGADPLTLSSPDLDEQSATSPEDSSESSSHSSASPLRETDAMERDQQQMPQQAQARLQAHAVSGSLPPAPQPILLGMHESHASFEPCLGDDCAVCAAPEILLTENRKVCFCLRWLC